MKVRVPDDGRAEWANQWRRSPLQFKDIHRSRSRCRRQYPGALRTHSPREGIHSSHYHSNKVVHPKYLKRIQIKHGRTLPLLSFTGFTTEKCLLLTKFFIEDSSLRSGRSFSFIQNRFQCFCSIEHLLRRFSKNLELNRTKLKRIYQFELNWNWWYFYSLSLYYTILYYNTIIVITGEYIVLAKLLIDDGRLDRMGLSEIECSSPARPRNDSGRPRLSHVAPFRQSIPSVSIDFNQLSLLSSYQLNRLPNGVPIAF